MKRTGIAILSAAALLASATTYAADASDISWTYVEGGWINADGDDVNSTDGVGLVGSLGFMNNFYAQFGYSALTSDSTDFGVDADIDTWAVAVGYHKGITTNTEGFFDVGYFDADFDASGVPGNEGDTDGMNFSTGLRYRASENAEFGGALVYTDGTVDGGSDSDFDFNDTSVRVYGQYFVNPAWSVGVRAALSGSGGGATTASGDSLTLFTRYSFGQLIN
jgi:hypothetical protein